MQAETVCKETDDLQKSSTVSAAFKLPAQCFVARQRRVERSPKGGTGVRTGLLHMNFCNVKIRRRNSNTVMAESDVSYVIGVDVGGTNTDAVVLCSNNVVAAAKRPTEEDKTSGIVNAISAALGEGLADGLAREAVVENASRVCIGTTHFVNAVVARDRSCLAPVAVVRLCGSASRSLAPFCDFPGDLREILCGGVHMVAGGFEYDLRSIAELDEAELRRVARLISQRQPPVWNVVVCGIFSPHDDPAGSNNQEQRAAEIIQSECPGITCTLSHKVYPQPLHKKNTKISLISEIPNFLSDWSPGSAGEGECCNS